MTALPTQDEGYDLFISYRSHKSGAHAVALRDSLYALDKRHAGERPMRIFLDRVSLKAGDLGPNIESGLRTSRNLVVLLDETTIQSPWVEQEISIWLAAGGDASHLFLVRTSRELDLGWDGKGFRNAAALPPALGQVFTAEQKYVDFVVPARRVDEVDLLPLYSTVMGVDPETMGEDERRFLAKQRRRNRRFISVLVSALVVALIAGGTAVVNAVRADEAAKQARADAMSAESLLTLPVSPAKAVDLAVGAARLADSTSIRSALLAVAADTGRLQQTMSLTADGEAERLAGVAFGPLDRTITAWGPTGDGSGTGVVTWSATNGSVFQRFTLPHRGVTAIAELPGVAYLVCAEDAALRVDWVSHESVVLSGRHDTCQAAPYAAGAALHLVVDQWAEEIVGVTVTGEQFRLDGHVYPARRSTINPVVVRNGSAVAVLGGSGAIEIPAAARGTVESAGERTLLTRSAEGRYHALRVEGGQVIEAAELQPPAEAVDVILWDDFTPPGKLAWVTADGRLGVTGAATTVELPTPTSNTTTPPRPALARLSYWSAVVAYGTDVYQVHLSGAPAVRQLGVNAAAVRQTLPSADSCQGGGAVILGPDAYVVNDQLFRRRGEFRNCHVVEVGPPVRVDGKEVLAGRFAGTTLTDIGEEGELLLAESDGLVSVHVAADEAAVPWRVSDSTGVVLSPDGTSTLKGGTPLLIRRGGQEHLLGTGASGEWQVVRPDGRGGVFTKNEAPWLAVQGGFPEPLDASCDYPRFEPAPGFESDVSAAEAQQAVGSREDGTRIDCISGEPLPDAPTILSYVVSETGSHIVAAQGGTVRVTTWRGAAKPVTRELPGQHPGASFAAMSTTQDRILIGTEQMPDVAGYRLNGVAWGESEHFATTPGPPFGAAFSPDGGLVLAVGVQGTFDVFDATSGRRLATQFKPLVEGDRFDRLAVTDRDGFLLAFLSGPSKTALVEIPVGSSQLRTLLCGVHHSTSC